MNLFMNCLLYFLLPMVPCCLIRKLVWNDTLHSIGSRCLNIFSILFWFTIYIFPDKFSRTFSPFQFKTYYIIVPTVLSSLSSFLLNPTSELSFLKVIDTQTDYVVKHRISLLNEIEALIICLSSAFVMSIFKNIHHMIGDVYGDEFNFMIHQTREYLTNYRILFSYVRRYLVPCYLSTLLMLYMYLKYRYTKIPILKSKYSIRFDPRILSFAHIFTTFFVVIIVLKPNNNKEGTFFERNFVNVSNSLFTFPKQKKNIIFISLESTETTMMSRKNGGIYEDQYLKILEQSALDPKNIHFSHSDKLLGGAKQLKRARLSVTANYAMTCGLPFVWTANFSQSTRTDVSPYYFPGVKCLGDILKEFGYTTSAIFGSDHYDWNVGYVFSTHGFQRVYDSKAIKGFGGYVRDYSVLEFARQKLTDAGNSGKPFYFHILTLDSHEPGYICKLCPDGPTALIRAFKCLDNQIKEFVEWCRRQPWFDNTVLFLHGDHFLRNLQLEDFSKRLNRSRTIFNLIINSEKNATNTKLRSFSSLDVMPTILSAAGVKIKGNTVNLGVDLFSGKKTLIETNGLQEVNDELEGVVTWYNKYYKGIVNECPENEPCLNSQMTLFRQPTYPKDNKDASVNK